MQQQQNPKNRLQEHCTRHHLAPPLYQEPVRLADTADHTPLWQSTLVMHSGQVCQGEPRTTKTDAEMSSAQRALDLLALQEMPPVPRDNTNVSTTTTSPMTIPKRVLLIDVENMPKFAAHLSEQHRRDFQCYAFVGEHHALADREQPQGVARVLSPSTRTDGTDSFMQVFAGILLAQGCTHFVVVTRDHFGAALCDALRSVPTHCAEARVVTHVRQL